MIAKSDLAILNANVLTMDNVQRRAEAVASANGTIIRVGSNREIEETADEHTLILDAAGKTVLPGFIDCHVHMMSTALARLELDLFGMSSLREMFEAIRNQAKRIPEGEWVKARGFDDSMVQERRYPTARELDETTPNHPVILKRQDGHSCVLNSKALEALQLPKDLNGLECDPKTGELTGILRQQANDVAREKIDLSISDDARMTALRESTTLIAQKGVTSLHALDGGVNDPRDVFLILKHQDELPVRIVPYYQTTNVFEVRSLNLPRIGGCLCIDGSMDSHTAALQEPYADNPSSSGVLYFTDEKLQEFVLEAHRNGLQIAMHAIGDRAVDQLLDAYENALKKHPRKDHRHRIEHIEVPTENQVKRCKELGIVLSIQPAFVYYWDMRNFYEARLGTQRAQRIHPYRFFLSEGILLGGGSDSPVTPIDPIIGIHAAVNHLIPSHSTSVEEALRFFTIDAAKLAFQEKTIGSIEAGKLADIVVLSENPIAVQRERLKEIKVEATIKNSRFTYQSPRICLRKGLS